jgi:hypothetical protein
MTIADVRTARRKLFIRLGQKHRRPGLGSSREFLARRTADMLWPNLTEVLQSHYAVVGGVATRLYMPERLTRDLDVVVAGRDADFVRKKLQDSGFKLISQLALIAGSTWLAPNGQEVDVIEGQEAWWPEAIQAAQANRDPQGQPVLTLPWLVLMKYKSGRSQDLADIDRMIGQADDETINAIRNVFARHLPTESDDLNSLIELAKLGQDSE